MEVILGILGVALVAAVTDYFTGIFREMLKYLHKFLFRNRDADSKNTVSTDEKVCSHTPEQRKALTNILFIDDKTDFKVVSILKRAGWKKTKIVKNVSGLDDRNISDADICFVDINGVAVELFPEDQGLGLVAAIKERHPEKKVVVYSSQREGDRFNELWDSADAKLPKDATPYEFENLVESFSEELYC